MRYLVEWLDIKPLEVCTENLHAEYFDYDKSRVLYNTSAILGSYDLGIAIKIQ